MSGMEQDALTREVARTLAARLSARELRLARGYLRAGQVEVTVRSDGAFVTRIGGGFVEVVTPTLTAGEAAFN